MREQADLLDHVADPAPQLRQLEPADAAAVDRDVAGVELDQPVDELQGGGLAGAGGADEHADLARPDREREVVDRRPLAPGVALRHAAEDDLRGRSVRGGQERAPGMERDLIRPQPSDNARTPPRNIRVQNSAAPSTSGGSRSTRCVAIWKPIPTAAVARYSRPG